MNVCLDRTITLETPRKRSRFLFLFWIAALLAGPAAHATTTALCVATVNGGKDANDYGLMAAISAAKAGPEGSSWDIRLRYGTYKLSGDLEFRPDGSHDNKSLSFTGGWNATCSSETGHASDTIVRGNDAFSSEVSFRGNNARYDIEFIRFEHLASFYLEDDYCVILDICPGTDSIYLEHNEFADGGPIGFYVFDARKFVFRNNLVANVGIEGPDFGAPVYFGLYTNANPPQIAFNTFAGLSCGDSADGAVQIFSSNSQLALHHNIVQTNVNSCPYDLFIATDTYHIEIVDQWRPSKLTPYFNAFGTIGGGVDGDVFGNGNVATTNLKFVDAANGNFRPQSASPAVNAGATLIGAIALGLFSSPIDLDGNVRPFGAHFDIGAFESNVYDGAAQVITVNSANDVDDGTCNAAHCSLREAINLANAQSGADQRIAFNIIGACPRVILLDSELPDITDPLTIDGYTQPGANSNGQDFGSDANICIAISPGAAGVSHALAVAAGQPDSTRLVVRGLAFGNGFYAFGTDAIDLRAGSGHRIVGNAFGGYLPPAHNSALIGPLPRAVLVRGTAKNVRIGTPAAADRNYLGNLSENGIVLNDATSTGHFIENNYIGVQPDGLTAQANQADGISASGGSGVTINGNTIAASDYGISLLGINTKGFTITDNRIGLNALGIPNATLSNNVGIAIGIGSGGHVIGAPATDQLSAGAHSNFIANNLGDGVLLAADGDPSSIRGNAIFSNGKGGSGIGIDLDNSQTQLVNDAGDADTGANALQNFPVISGSAPTDASHRKVNATLNTSANKAVRVDFYQSPTCGGAQGADATNLVGSTNVDSGASGIVKISTTIAEAGTSGYLTATATTSTGQTSELATCVREDVIFKDGLEQPGT